MTEAQGTIDALIDHARRRFLADDLREPLYITPDEFDALRNGCAPFVTLFGLSVVVDAEKAAQRDDGLEGER